LFFAYRRKAGVGRSLLFEQNKSGSGRRMNGSARERRGFLFQRRDAEEELIAKEVNKLLYYTHYTAKYRKK
jgi:hypothetical protein